MTTRVAALALGLAVAASALGSPVPSRSASAAGPLPEAGLVGSGDTLLSVRALGLPVARGGGPGPPPALGSGYVPGAAPGYVPGSNVVIDGRGLAHAGHGPARPLEDPATALSVGAAVAADRSWLAAGTVPGATPAEREMATRALLDLRLLVRPGGAAVAAWHPRWRYVWPRDASFMAVALAVTGHSAEALDVLGFLARAQRADGTWEARYYPDGSGPVRDGRAPQLDAAGWVPWAVWVWHASAPGGPVARAAADAALRRLWPMVRGAADAAEASLDGRGLPHPSADYWEAATGSVTLGTAAPLRTGLRAAAQIAAAVGQPGRAARWAAAAERLHEGIEGSFAPLGYLRAPQRGSGADAAVTFLAPPFAAYDARVAAAVERTAARLTTHNGGVVPGEAWPHGRAVAWSPQTAFFALAAAAAGDRAGARARLGWLAAHRTTLGVLPEKIGPDGSPAAVAPLGWTDALVLLTLAAIERPLPTPGPTAAAAPDRTAADVGGRQEGLG